MEKKTLFERFDELVPIEFGGMQEPLLTNCVKLADEHAIEFSYWKDRYCIRKDDGFEIKIPLGSIHYKTYNNTELLTLYKKESE